MECPATPTRPDDRGDRLTVDVAVCRDGMIHAVISERGGRRPDVMVLAEMRAKLTTVSYDYRPAGVARQTAVATA